MPTNRYLVRTPYGEGEIPLTESTVDLTIPGAQSATFVHISDLHFSVAEPQDTPERKAKVVERNNFWFAAYGFRCRTPEGERKLWPHEVCEVVAERIREIAPDAVCITGDAVDLPAASSYRAVRRYCEGLGCPYILVPGNHDTLEESDMDPETHREMCDLFGDARHFTEKEIKGYHVLGFSDEWIKITPEQIRFLEEQLQTGAPLIPMFHAPLLTESVRERTWGFWGRNWLIGEEQQPEENRRFRDLLYANQERIACILAGHLHYSTGDDDLPNLPGEPLQYTAAPAYTGYLRVIRVNGGK